MSTIENQSALRRVLDEACEESGYNKGELTVLANQHDPFRVDTPARHRDGEWLAVQAESLGLGDRVIHLRGLHYMLVSGEVLKPDGEMPYSNTEADWVWLQEHAAKAARWLGYIPFEQIADQRNAEPKIVKFEPVELEPYVSVGVQLDIPDAEDLEPRAGVAGFEGRQPYRLVLIGEKSSLQDVLGPIATEHEADLYLPTGEPSDTRLRQMASDAAEDGRRLIAFYFSDCDPSGWQMPISVSRKLQALRALQFPGLSFELHRVALAPEQVRQYGLPFEPLERYPVGHPKAGQPKDKRALRWEQEMGVAQTEIDSLAALKPELLDQIAREAVAPFFDYTLKDRVEQARREWESEAQAALEEQTDQDKLDRIRTDAEGKLDQLRDELDAINDAMRMEVGDYALPEAVIPEPELDGEANGLPLIDSDWSYVEQTLALKRSKAYENGA